MIVASNNSHKLEEIKAILADTGLQIYSLKEVSLEVEIEETGDTFTENALIKARTICNMTGQAVIADDSGLEVMALDGAPGVHSARYSGVADDKKDQKNNEKLKKNMENVSEEDRQARFCSVIAVVFPDGKELIAEGFVYGKIGYEEKGSNGFGYDPLFIVDGFGKTMAELTSEEKNKISHRAHALAVLRKKLSDELHI